MTLARACPQCGRISAGRGRCANCARPARAGATLYDSARWQKLRAQVRARDGACTRCGTTTNLSVHHADGDWRNNDPANLVTLCRRCHGRIDGAKARLLTEPPPLIPSQVGARFRRERREADGS